MNIIEKYYKQFIILRNWIECNHIFTPTKGASSYYDECKLCEYSLPKLENKVKELLNKHEK